MQKRDRHVPLIHRRDEGREVGRVAGMHQNICIAHADMRLKRELAFAADLARRPQQVADDGRIIEPPFA